MGLFCFGERVQDCERCSTDVAAERPVSSEPACRRAESHSGRVTKDQSAISGDSLLKLGGGLPSPPHKKRPAWVFFRLGRGDWMRTPFDLRAPLLPMRLGSKSGSSCEVELLAPACSSVMPAAVTVAVQRPAGSTEAGTTGQQLLRRTSAAAAGARAQGRHHHRPFPTGSCRAQSRSGL